MASVHQPAANAQRGGQSESGGKNPAQRSGFSRLGCVLKCSLEREDWRSRNGLFDDTASGGRSGFRIGFRIRLRCGLDGAGRLAGAANLVFARFERLTLSTSSECDDTARALPAGVGDSLSELTGPRIACGTGSAPVVARDTAVGPNVSAGELIEDDVPIAALIAAIGRSTTAAVWGDFSCGLTGCSKLAGRTK